MKKKSDLNKLTKKEQATTTAYKMMVEKTKTLEESLKKTQDESEKDRAEKHELDKKVVLLESKLNNNTVLEIFKFLSAGGFGFSANYITSGNFIAGLIVGIPSVVIFVSCIVIERK